MPDFLENLRMANIYGGQNPFTPTEVDPLQMVSKVAMARQGWENAAFPRGQMTPSMQAAQTGPINTGAPPPGPQNTVFTEEMTPFQKAQLGESAADRASREKIAGIGAQSREDIAAAGNKIKQQRADAYDFKTRNPNLKFETNKVTGELNAINPLTGQIVKSFGKMQLGEEEVANLNEQNKEKAITVQGEQERKNIDERGAQARETQAAKGPKELSPIQQKTLLQMRAEEAYNKFPDYRKLLQIESGGQGFTIKAPVPGWFSGGKVDQKDVENYQKLKDHIYKGIGSELNTSSTTPTAPTGPAKVTPPAALSGDRVTIYKDGKAVGTVPKSQSDQAVSEGYSLTAPTPGGK